MRRILIVAIATALLGALAAGAAGARGHRAMLRLSNTSVGTILANGRGFTVYAFTRDHRNQDACVKIKGCTGLWPPVTTTVKPSAGPGVNKSLIGTIKLRNGVKQVTYARHPLYTYAADPGPGSTFYVNFFQFGGRWPAMNASGKEVK